MKNAILALTAVLFTACNVSKLPDPTYTSKVYPSAPIQESLFKSKDRTISEEDIRKLLDGKIVLPDQARIAVHNFGTTSLNRYYASHWYNEELLKMKQNYIETLTSTISASNNVGKVILMPSILTNPSPTLTNLRESAVRLQADILIIFSIKSDIYYQYKAFKKDQAKAFATIELVLLDIRTGVVPYSNIITTEQLIQKESTDLNIRDTQKRAENEAVLSALTQSGKGLRDFLDSISE